MGHFAPLGAQVLAGVAVLHGQEGGQNLRHHGRGPAAAARQHAALGQQRQQQLARASGAPSQGRQDVPPLQERHPAHQVMVLSAPADHQPDRCHSVGSLLIVCCQTGQEPEHFQ